MSEIKSKHIPVIGTVTTPDADIVSIKNGTYNK